MSKLNSWIKNIEVYFDGRLQSANTEIETLLKDEFTILGHEKILPLDEYRSTHALKILVISSENPKQFEPNANEFHILIESTNTNLFDFNEHKNIQAKISRKDDLEPVLNDLYLRIASQIEKIEVDLLNYSQDFFKKIVQKKKIDSYDFKKFANKYDSLLVEIISCLDMKELMGKIEKITQAHLNCKFSLCDSFTAYSLDLSHLIPFKIKDDLYFLTWDVNQDYTIEKALYTYNAVEQFSKRLESNVLRIEYGNDYQTIINAVPFPFVLFDEAGVLTLHNAKFVNLNLTAKKCLKLKDNEQVTLRNELYKVHKLSDGGVTLFYFVRVKDFIEDDTHTDSSSSDLGIITSSIAHELNNPLAGIMAALDVILLDFESPEMADNVNQMKDTVNRCKKLVETFLGFSKYRPQTQSQYNNKIQESFNQALELIRFRLIENNLNIVTHFEHDHSFENNFNPHVMSMIFYLTLGELLTNFSHHKLVSDDRSTSILIEFVEGKNNITIKKPEEFSLSAGFLNGRLIRHLINTQSMRLNYSSSEISFYM
tara:strand:+ start:194120 stop:195739 length:1620 start_codon:yes stop_codon:yes gene_type:complete